MTSDVGKDLGLQAELANSFAVLARLFGGGRASEFNIICAELVQGLCDFDLFRSVKVGIRKSVTESVPVYFWPLGVDILLAFS